MSLLSDAEHPSLIPTDVPTSPSTPLGPMTRARAKAIEAKVNSLLSELPLTTHETWILPHSETLCVITYMEVSQGSTTCKTQDGEDPKHVEEEEKMQQKLQASDVRPCLDVRRVPGHGRPSSSDVWCLATRTESTNVRDAPDDQHPSQNYGRPIASGRPAPPEAPDIRPSTDDRRAYTRAEIADVRALPDNRTVQSLRTSDAFRMSDS